jgi:hypothetical protein
LIYLILTNAKPLSRFRGSSHFRYTAAGQEPRYFFAFPDRTAIPYSNIRDWRCGNTPINGIVRIFGWEFALGSAGSRDKEQKRHN